MGKQLDTEIIKEIRMRSIICCPAFDRKSSAETIRGAAGIVLRKTIKYTIPQE
jgi:hypothetical protein